MFNVFHREMKKDHIDAKGVQWWRAELVLVGTCGKKDDTIGSMQDAKRIFGGAPMLEAIE